MPTRAYFQSIAEAVSYARQNGGWIAKCFDGTVQWFDASKWTLTPIIDAVCAAGGAEIGVWPLFDADHECHKILGY